jgi:acetyltransferase-like isoleucine patch superfamily enzyme
VVKSILRKIWRKLKVVIVEVSPSNIYLMAKLKKFKLPLIIFRSVFFRMGPNARIEWASGKLRLGHRWEGGRFRESEFIIQKNGTLEVRGSMSIATGCFISINEGAILSLGSGGINFGAKIAVFERITIGNNVYISENVTMRDSDNHGFWDSIKPICGPITICDNAWIGVNVTILKGVTIGEGAVVAANSLVNKNVPPYALVGGVPARIIRENVNWKKDVS